MTDKPNAAPQGVEQLETTALRVAPAAAAPEAPSPNRDALLSDLREMRHDGDNDK